MHFCTIQANYRVSHLIVDVGWVDSDWGVPPSSPAASAKFPSAKSESGRRWNTQSPSQSNPVQEQMGHPVETSTNLSHHSLSPLQRGDLERDRQSDSSPQRPTTRSSVHASSPIPSTFTSPSLPSPYKRWDDSSKLRIVILEIPANNFSFLCYPMSCRAAFCD